MKQTATTRKSRTPVRAKAKAVPVHPYDAPSSDVTSIRLEDLVRKGKYVAIFSATPGTRTTLIRKGVPATIVDVLSKSMHMPKANLFTILKFPKSTMDRKLSKKETLSSGDGERLVGLVKLVGQVQAMVEESGNPEGFDAAQWFARWIEEPSPALGGKTPASFMDTGEGRETISNLLSMMQSGAYA